MFQSKVLPVFVTAFGLLCGCQGLKYRTEKVSIDSLPQPAANEVTTPESFSLAPTVVNYEKESRPALPNPVLGLEDRLPSERSEEMPDYFRAEEVNLPTGPPPSSPNLTFTLPLWQDDHHAWFASATASQSAPLPETVFATTPPPATSWTVGTTFQHRLENGWIDGVNTSVESTGTGFIPTKELMSVFLQVPQGKHDSWLFQLVHTSTDRSPLLKIEHVWQPSGWFQADTTLTLPVSDRSSNGISLDLTLKILRPMVP